MYLQLTNYMSIRNNLQIFDFGQNISYNEANKSNFKGIKKCENSYY